MNRFVRFWSIKRLKNKHVISCIILIALVVTPVVCALVLSDSMIKAMSEKYIFLSSGHLTVSNSENHRFDEYKDIKYSNLICSGYAMMYSQNDNTTLYIKGVEDDYFNEDRLKHITYLEEKNTDSNIRGITISEYSASLLNLHCGDKVAMMIVPDSAGKSMRPVIVQIEKIYSTGYEAIDSNLAFISFDYAKTLFENPESISTEIILYDETKIDAVRNDILSNYDVSSWMSSNYAVFSNFVTSKQVIFIILVVVLIMAGFYTASAARLANEDCISQIAIFKMIGANDNHIFVSSLFTMMVATILGIIFGLLLGLLISFNFTPILHLLSNAGIKALSYYLIDFTPVVNWKSIILCLFILITISFLSVAFVIRKTRKITPLQLFNSN